jgi:hypothetical protein
MKRRCLIATGLLAICGIVAITVPMMLPPRPGVTKANCDRISKGMTRTEVEQVLGPQHDRFAAMIASSSGTMSFEQWVGADRAAIHVTFHDDRAHEISWQESPETFGEKIRRWLHMN